MVVGDRGEQTEDRRSQFANAPVRGGRLEKSTRLANGRAMSTNPMVDTPQWQCSVRTLDWLAITKKFLSLFSGSSNLSIRPKRPFSSNFLRIFISTD